jgi:hypothetical protein
MRLSDGGVAELRCLRCLFVLLASARLVSGSTTSGQASLGAAIGVSSGG